MNLTIEILRKNGVVLATLGNWIVVLALGFLAFNHGEHALTAAALSALLSIAPTIAALKERRGSLTRMTIGVVAALQPTLLLFAMQGGPWQLDMHLYFLVALTLLVPLCDSRVIMTACAIGVLNHAMLALVAPQWVFWGGGGLLRSAFHAGAIVATGASLCVATSVLTKTLRKLAELEHRSAKQARQIEEGLLSLRSTQAKMKTERETGARERAELIAAREKAIERIAAEFERSVSAVTQSVASTAQMLERSARSLELTADQAGIEARDVVGSAETARKAANTVAAGVAELSLSIAEVAANVSQQSDLASIATERSDTGGSAIGMLTGQSRTIGEATRAIVRIAERTNLLSLNAAIEAASAGPAGRGFNIVAHEVKVLAGQASQAATEIEAFLEGVRSGTLEAERSFKAIDSAIDELERAATSIRYDVENQRQSADTIESFARHAANQTDVMVGQSQALAERAEAAKRLSGELGKAAAALMESVQNLEHSTAGFTSSLRAA